MAVSWGEAQAAVIGAGLIDAGCVPLILAEMRPSDFNGACLSFFEAFRALTAEHTHIDPVEWSGGSARNTARRRRN